MLGGMLAVFGFSSLGLPLALAAVLAVGRHGGGSASSSSFVAIRPRDGRRPAWRSSSSPSAAALLMRSLARHAFGPDERRAAGVHARAVDHGGRRGHRPPDAVGMGRRARGGRRARRSLYSQDAPRPRDAGVRGQTATPRGSWASTRACVVTVELRARGRARRARGRRGHAAHADRVRRRRRASGLKGFAAAILGGLGNPVAAVAGGLRARPAREPVDRVHLLDVQGRHRARRAPAACCSSGRRDCSARSRGRRCERARARASTPGGARGRRRRCARAGRCRWSCATAYLLKVLTFVGLNVIVVIGLSLLFGYAGQISLGHAAFVGHRRVHVGVPRRRRTAGRGRRGRRGRGRRSRRSAGWCSRCRSLRLKGHYLAMATLGFGEIMSHRVRRGEGRSPAAPTGSRGIPFASHRRARGSTRRRRTTCSCGVSRCVVFVLARNIVRPRPGRALRALHGSEAGRPGVRRSTPSRVKVQVFALSAGLGGAGGRAVRALRRVHLAVVVRARHCRSCWWRWSCSAGSRSLRGAGRRAPCCSRCCRTSTRSCPGCPRTAVAVPAGLGGATSTASCSSLVMLFAAGRHRAASLRGCVTRPSPTGEEGAR